MVRIIKVLGDIGLAQTLLEPSLNQLIEGVDKCKMKAEEIMGSFNKLLEFAKELQQITANETSELRFVSASIGRQKY